MTLHIFNPEHDMALAFGKAGFTAPHAGRLMHRDLAYLPLLWADATDLVLVDDVGAMRRALVRKPVRGGMLVGAAQLHQLHISRIEPWGWDAALTNYLRRNGVDEALLPSEHTLADIREMSHRRTAAEVLGRLRERMVVKENLTGEVVECSSEEACMDVWERWGRQRVVVKAPWSCSGRGVRFVDDFASPSLQGWLRRTIQQQGAVMVEPYYNKVKDFGMEFVSDGQGGVRYCGLSLFHTSNGAYTGNVVATEEYKRGLLSRYIEDNMLSQLEETLTESLLPLSSRGYAGTLGVDMMVAGGVDGTGFLVHPCVEINLRRTMGHVALDIARNTPGTPPRVMRIEYENGNYKLKLKRL